MVKDGFVVAEKYKQRFEELGKTSYSSLSVHLIHWDYGN